MNFYRRIVCALIASLMATHALSQDLSGWSDKTVCRLASSQQDDPQYLQEAKNRGLSCGDNIAIKTASDSSMQTFRSVSNPTSQGALPQIGTCSGSLTQPSSNDATSKAFSDVNLQDHLAGPVRTKLLRYRSFRLGDKYANGEKGGSAPEVKLVADFNNDGLDDVMIDYFESNAAPGIYLSKGNGEFELQDNMPDAAGRRHIRNASAVDLNNDGWLDIAGFTTGDPYKDWALYGFKGKKSLIPRGEKDLLLINLQGKGFRHVEIPEIRVNDWNHSGTVGDIDEDGLIDILPLSEGSKERTEPLRNEGNDEFSFTKKEYSRAVSYFQTSDIEVADLNKDGHLDLVVTVNAGAKNGKFQRDTGTAHIIYGDGDFNFTDNKKLRIGNHWLSEKARQEFNKKISTFTANERGVLKALFFGASNIELIDIDGDGLKDIFTGFFIDPAFWSTSGFTLLKNHSDCFSDETGTFFPNQITNRHFAAGQTTGYTHNVFHGDINGDSYKDIVLQMDGAQQWDENPYDYHPNFFINSGSNVYLPLLRNSVPGYSRADFHSLGDVNGDGAIDLITLESKANGSAIVARLQWTEELRDKTEQENKIIIAKNKARLKKNALKIKANKAEELVKQKAKRIEDASKLAIFNFKDDAFSLTLDQVDFIESELPQKQNMNNGFELHKASINGELKLSSNAQVGFRTLVYQKLMFQENRLLINVSEMTDPEMNPFKRHRKPLQKECGLGLMDEWDWLSFITKTSDIKIAKNQQCHYDYFKEVNDREAFELFQAVLGGTDSILDYLQTNVER
jgi:hypothetical protein